MRPAGPRWLLTMHKNNRVRSTPYPPGCILLAVKLMCDRLIPASQTLATMCNVLEECGVNVDEYDWPSAPTLGSWRAGCEASVLAQFGMEMSAAVQRGDKLAFGADGGAVDRHVEGMVIKSSTGRFSLVPWEQGSKAGSLTAANTATAIERGMEYYKQFYELCVADKIDMSAYAPPATMHQVILALHVSQRDHAVNEEKRVEAMNKLKLAAFEAVYKRPPTAEEKEELCIIDGTCGTHKIMLIATECRKADHTVITERVGTDRDCRIREFSSKNALDSFQLQIHKMFDPHAGAYVFGDGFTAFPTWMKAKHPGKLRRMHRLIGNRALIFCVNALVHFMMLDSYVAWTSYTIREKGSANMLHIRIDAKARTIEVSEGLRARGILYVHILNVIRMALKSKKVGTSFLRASHFYVKSLEVAQKMQDDPEFLLDYGYEIFPGDTKVMACRRRWLVKNEDVVKPLFVFNENDDKELCLTILRAYGVAMEEQLRRNS